LVPKEAFSTVARVRINTRGALASIHTWLIQTEIDRVFTKVSEETIVTPTAEGSNEVDTCALLAAGLISAFINICFTRISFITGRTGAHVGGGGHPIHTHPSVLAWLGEAIINVHAARQALKSVETGA
jgi:hypothetical protein